jgi:hypothetical protein
MTSALSLPGFALFPIAIRGRGLMNIDELSEKGLTDCFATGGVQRFVVFYRKSFRREAN